MYAVAALATAVTTVAPLATTPASGIAGPEEPVLPYIVTARNRADARDLLGETPWRVRRFYTAVLPGFATYLSAQQAARLRTDARVRALEPDRRLRRSLAHPARRVHQHGGAGRGVTFYVVDSGLDADHHDLGDRAWRAYDATGGRERDCDHHGTRVARALAGRAHGVAREARIASVRVLDCAGTGTLSDVIAGLDWIRGHARGPAVTSLPVPVHSAALEIALHRLARAGVPVVTGPAAAARLLESPSALASWWKSTTARDVIRQNPTRTLPGRRSIAE
ncbi:S8 family serine peptidase [Nonomuraea sediminis]|uniref:S8 family serine peptidase n=1 Tax=Nonomuraea sediminis TaxID=2835864 RepID=UPI001BDBCCFA|nr:S8 family serine peptidase [Nonomuraea sediminis]